MRHHPFATALAGAALLCVGMVAFGNRPADGRHPAAAVLPAAGPAAPTDTVALSADQARQIRVVPVVRHTFVPWRDALGTIDFDQDRSAQVFSQCSGRVRQVYARAGDDVRQGQPLFSLDSPDLLNAESSLIASSVALRLSTLALERQRRLVQLQAAAQKELDQAIADQQTAEVAHRAARDAVHLFGKTDADIATLLDTRRLDGELVVRSPISGRVTARNLAPGVLLQPGSLPPPFVVSDLAVMWLQANVQEGDIPLLRRGAPVEVSVLAYPGRSFHGAVTYLGEAVDPATHRLPVRSEIHDPGHALRPQMLARYRIQTGAPVAAPVIPQNGLVREGDGTLAVFLTRDGRSFERREVRIGMADGDLVQVLAGVVEGERVAADGALFLANALALQTR